MEKKSNIIFPEIGDYVYDIGGLKSLTGVVINFTDNDHYWVRILNLSSMKLSKPIHMARLYKSVVPEQYETLYNLLKINNFSLNL